jgi:alkylation response protein AidB-like acyl-CoA dehydrogenase
VDFDLTDEQVLLQQTVAGIVGGARTQGLVRAGENSADGHSAALTRQLAQVGLAGLLAPESCGGTGQSLFEFALAAEQLGRGPVSTPLLAQAWGAQVPLSCGAATGRTAELLTELAGGAGIMTMAHLEPGMHDEWSRLTVQARETESGVTLTGAKILVPYGGSASAVIVSAVTPGGDACICLVRLPHDGAVLTPQLATGGDPMCRLDLDAAPVRAEDLLLRGQAAESAIAASLEAGTVMELAYGVGLAAEAVAMSARYASERTQFGRPIGSFQAVAHRCADMLIDLDAARVLVYRAAWELASGSGSEAAEAVAVAKVFSDDAFSRIFVSAHQIHGAIGFSMEYDLQLFTRRAKAVELGFGIKQRHLKRVAACAGT